jgi:flagellar basal-body rod protein FlgC
MSLFTSLAVSGSGMSAQRTRAEILVENLANAETTRTAEGGPYKRKDVVFSSAPIEGSFHSVLSAEIDRGAGVRVSEVVTDTRDPEMRYMPGHPDADADGYVKIPRMSPAEEMVDLLGASKSYQANVAAISAVKDMIQKSVELFR